MPVLFYNLIREMGIILAYHIPITNAKQFQFVVKITKRYPLRDLHLMFLQPYLDPLKTRKARWKNSSIVGRSLFAHRRGLNNKFA